MRNRELAEAGNVHLVAAAESFVNHLYQRIQEAFCFTMGDGEAGRQLLCELKFVHKIVVLIPVSLAQAPGLKSVNYSFRVCKRA